MKLALGIDVGTGGTRALLVDASGGLVAEASRPHSISQPKPAWSEQDPREWWRAACGAVRAALEEAGATGADVAAVGLSGQMHGLVMLDEADEVIRPAILWNDQRSAVECEELTEKIGQERLLEIACNPMLAGFTAPKIAWVAKHEPANLEKTRHVLLPKDYVRFMLTAEYATDMADGSGMLLMNVPGRKYSPEIVGALGIDGDILPKLYESPDVTGTVTKTAAEATGLIAGTPVVGGAGDQAAAAVGNGIISEGLACATLGTSGVVFAATDKLLVDIPKGRVHSFCHAVPGKWHIMGVVLASGGSYQWVRNNLAEVESQEAEKRGVDVYEVLSEKAMSVPPGSEGLIFLPYLTGERSPINDAYARGGWIGLTMRHTKAHLIRAVVEGASLAMLDCMEVVRELGVEVTDVRLSGGGAVSPLWQTIQASLYDRPVSLLQVSEGSAYGAALLAMVGGGMYASVEEACKSVVKVTKTVDPDPEAVAVYKKVFPLYQTAYRQLKDEFKALGEVE